MIKSGDSLLQWEIEWIMSNVDRYNSVLHAKSVCNNIIKRYKIRQLENKIKSLEDKL